VRSQRGITLVEIMVAVLLVSIAAAFTFGIQIRASGAFRDQATVAELQQTLRAVSDLLVKDLRFAGYRAVLVHTVNGGTPDYYAIEVQNGAGGYGSDILRIQYGEESKMARITVGAFGDPQATVDVVGGFVVGDVALATARAPTSTAFNHGCLVQVTGTIPGPPAMIQYAATPPWNAGGNPQCAELTADWSGGYASFTRAVLRSYRVRPGDQRGVLEMSPSGGLVANDWVPLAVGIVDLQVAIRVNQPGDTADDDNDGAPTRDWYSGDNMATARGLVAASEVVQVSVSVVAKSSKEIGGPTLTLSPSLLGSTTYPNNNSIGDHAGTALPVTDTTSPYYGDFIYRMYTSTVDLRNVGVGL